MRALSNLHWWPLLIIALLCTLLAAGILALLRPVVARWRQFRFLLTQLSRQYGDDASP